MTSRTSSDGLRGVALAGLARLFPLALCFLPSACASSQNRGVVLDREAASPEIQALAIRARTGDKQAQLDLGIRYEEGNGLPRGNGDIPIQHDVSQQLPLGFLEKDLVERASKNQRSGLKFLGKFASLISISSIKETEQFNSPISPDDSRTANGICKKLEAWLSSISEGSMLQCESWEWNSSEYGVFQGDAPYPRYVTLTYVHTGFPSYCDDVEPCPPPIFATEENESPSCGILIYYRFIADDGSDWRILPYMTEYSNYISSHINKKMRKNAFDVKNRFCLNIKY